MTQDYIFKENDIAYTAWGEKVELRECMDAPLTHLEFTSKYLQKDISVNLKGYFYSDDKQTLIYPHPVRVTPVLKFEEGEEIEVQFNNSCHVYTGVFIGKYDGRFVVCVTAAAAKSYIGSIMAFDSARKITKPEKTIEELKDEYIQKLISKISLLERIECKNKYGHGTFSDDKKLEWLNQEISSLQEQLKQKE